MISNRSRLKKLGIISGLLIFAFVMIFFVRRDTPSISIFYIGLRDTPQGPRHLFEISNSLPYRVNWMDLEPEFKLKSGWTTTEPPPIPGGRSSPGNPEPLEPGGSFQIFGSPVTNVAHRLPVMWEIYPADARRRPKWQRAADEWAERRGIRPLFLPHGIQRSPVIPPKSTDRITAISRDVRSEEVPADDTTARVVDRQASISGSISVASGGVYTPRVVFAGPTSLEGWIQGQARTASQGAEAWNYTNGALVATAMGSIARDVQLPTVARVDFDLAWSKSLHLAVALYADSEQPLNLSSKDTPPLSGFYSLQLNGDSASVFAVSPGMPPNTLGMAMVPRLRDATAVRVSIRIHKPQRRLCLYIDDTLIKQWEDGRNTLGSRTWLRFVNPGTSRLEISNLIVSEWDGETTSPVKARPGIR